METPFATNELAAADPSEQPRRYRRPYYDIFPANEHYEIRVLMPGVGKERVNVSLEGRNLQVEGKRQHQPDESRRPILNELNWDDYRLNLELNVAVEEDSIAAHVGDGILTLTLPKAEEAKPRRIEVK